MKDKEGSSYTPTVLKRTSDANEEGRWVGGVVVWVVAEAVVEGDVWVMVVWLTAGLVAVVVTETVGEAIDGAIEVVARLAGIWVEWVEG